MGKSYHHLTWEQRLKIEALNSAGIKPTQIAKQLGVHHSTVYRELSRGKTWKRRSSDWKEVKIYSPELAQEKTERNRRERARPLKIGNDYEFVQYVEKMILEERYSPEALLADIKRKKLEFQTQVCLTTLYNYIKRGIFLNLTMEDCPYRKLKPKRTYHRRRKRIAAGPTIEDRPKEINLRKDFGHWEMDTVVGGQRKSKKSLLVLTERKTRKELIHILSEHTMSAVVRVLDQIERKVGEKTFRYIFKSITVDNGTEFSDWKGMKSSRRNKKDRTQIFYCHPYSSWERGSNENQNKLVRRWYPKGGSFDKVTKREIKYMENWINDYPRKIFNYSSANELFQKELSKIKT